MTLEQFRLVIDGEVVDAASGATFPTIDPHTGQAYGEAAEAGQEDVLRAVAAARAAFDDGPWPRYSTQERRRLLHRLADRVEEHFDRLAEAETRDMGKPITESRARDIPRVSGNLRFFADYVDLSTAEAFPADGYHTYTTYGPKGVVAAISPWNFPLMLATWKVAPALAFGNTVVLKPAEQSPATASLFGELAAEVLPPGVLNVVHGFGPGAVGEFLVASPGVDLVTFTGETRTGAAIMANAAATLKGVSMEMGGKSPNIVFADADLDAAVAGAVRAIYTNNGEVCLAGSRLFVERPIYDEFLSRLTDAATSLRVGNPMDPATEIGPLVSDEHRQKVESYLSVAEEEGGKVLFGGTRPTDPDLAAGYYVNPAVLVGLDNRTRCAQEEIFGPVLVAMPFDDEDEVLTWANDSPYGLAAMLWTTNLSRAHRMAGALRTGMVWINCFFVRDLRTPFGGAKQSGIGREGGIHSREFFTEAKTVTIAI